MSDLVKEAREMLRVMEDPFFRDEKLVTVRAMIRALADEVERLEGDRGSCVWSADGVGSYETSCGNCFEFNDSGPEENNAKYCLFCGKPIEAVEEDKE